MPYPATGRLGRWPRQRPVSWGNEMERVMGIEPTQAEVRPSTKHSLNPVKAVVSPVKNSRLFSEDQSFSIFPTRMPLTSQCPRTRASFMSEKEWVPTALLSTSIHRHSK